MAAILPYSSTAATLARNVSTFARPAARMIRYAGGARLIKSAATALWQWNNRRRLFNAIKKAGQGRVPNWKQVKQTGVGLKVRRKHRRGKVARIKRRRRIRRSKRKYFNWLYRNRPIPYRSIAGGRSTLQVYNMAMDYTLNSLQYPGDSYLMYNVNPSFPGTNPDYKSNYICYKINYNFLFHYDDLLTGDMNNRFTHAYIRVLVFRKWGAHPNFGSDIWSMFKRPYLMTSGYVHGFKRIWCANFNVQLYMDKLLRISGDTNWVTQFHFNIYPRMKSLWTTAAEPNRWFYSIIILGGFGAEDKYDNLFTSQSGTAQCSVDIKYDTVSYFRYSNGMPTTTTDSTRYVPVGTDFAAIGPVPNSMDVESGSDSSSAGQPEDPQTGASGSGSVPAEKITILHDDN